MNSSFSKHALIRLIAAGLVTLAAHSAEAVEPSTGDGLVSTLLETRVLDQPLARIGEPAGDEAALMEALKTFRERERADDVSALTGFLSAHPDTPWRASLLVNLGIIYRQTGYFTRALEAWERAWAASREEQEGAGHEVADRAAVELAELNARLGRQERLVPLFEEIGDRVVTGGLTERLAAARNGLWVMQNRPGEAFRCGPMALDRICAATGVAPGRYPAIMESKSTVRGIALDEVARLGDEIGLQLTPARRAPGADVILPALVHWKAGHYAALIREEKKQILVQDPTFGDEIWISRQALDDEASGYFLVPAGKALPEGWTAVEADEAKTVWGKGQTTGVDLGASRSADEKQPPVCPKPGMAAYGIHAMLVSLNIVDVPLSYEPPRGPDVTLRVTYNQRDAGQPSVFNFANLGAKWTLDWISFLTDNPAAPSANIDVYVSGGGFETYTGYNSGTQTFAMQPLSQSFLKRTGSASYERTLPDGTREIFDVTDGATSNRRVFLTRRIDPTGNDIRFIYDTQLRLTTVIDATGRQTALEYNHGSDPLKITAVQDPDGRRATFDYNGAGLLWKITDPVGIVSEFTYGTGDTITDLTTPYGVTHFEHETIGDGRRITVTEPDGAKQRTEFMHLAPGIGATESAVPTGMTLFNSYLNYRNTFYWDKKAMKEAPGDYTKARMTHWLHTTNINVASGVPESRKNPLEGRVWYNYPGQSWAGSVGTSSLPSLIGRVLDDATTQLYKFEYNTVGNLTKFTDPKNRITAYTYAANGIDLLEVRQKTSGVNELLATYTYNAQHQPLTFKDAAGRQTTYAYNGFGQLTTVTNPKNEINQLDYAAASDPDGVPEGYLKTVTSGLTVSGTGALPAPTQLRYDSMRRVSQVIDPEGYTVNLSYDALGGDPAKTLDRLAKVTYPDGTTEETTFDRLYPEWLKDRLGQWTRLYRDATGKVIAVMDPAYRFTQYAWCLCGSLKSITDPMGRTTRWKRDVQGRATEKEFADGKKIIYTYEATTSRLKSSTDARGQTTSYSYYADDDLWKVIYTNAVISTPTVTFNYDSKYRRLSSFSDGQGTTSFTYNAITSTPQIGAGRLQKIDQPWMNGVIEFVYDELGRVVTRKLNGVSATATFDALGRASSIVNALGTFNNTWVGVSGRLDYVTGPGGQKADYDYEGLTGDRRLKQIHNSTGAGALLSKFDYGYDALGRITSWRQETPAQAAFTFEPGYNRVSELTSAVKRNAGSGTVLKEYVWGYDRAGNRLWEQVDSAITQDSHNTVNQLLSRTAGGWMRFRGTVDEEASVSVNGYWAGVDAQGNFEGWAPVSAGSNEVAITATDALGNAQTNRYSVSVPAATASTFTYDANGNLTGDGVRTFEWDAADRLVTVIKGTERHEFSYDGLGRRIRIVRKVNGSTQSDNRYLWSGLELVEKRNSGGGSVLTRYFPQGMTVVSGTPTGNFFYTRDHLGSIREMTDSTGAVRARYDYDLWGRRTKLGGDLEADFGYTGHFHQTATGLTLAPYRAYDAELGRWLSPDPIGEEGGLNLYGYVSNNPVNSVDSWGLDEIPWWASAEYAYYYYLYRFVGVSLSDTEYSEIAQRNAAYTYEHCPLRGGFVLAGGQTAIGKVNVEGLGLLGWDIDSGGYAGGLAAGGRGHVLAGYEWTTAGHEPILLVDSHTARIGAGLYFTPESWGVFLYGDRAVSEHSSAFAGGGVTFGYSQTANFFSWDYWLGNLTAE